MRQTRLDTVESLQAVYYLRDVKRGNGAIPFGLNIRQGTVATRDRQCPKVLLAILAKQKEATLPLYLRCIEALDYPKKRIALYVRTNNNTDCTRDILWDWLKRVRQDYAQVSWNDKDVAEPVQELCPHEWTWLRFQVLGRIRQESLRKTIEWGCDSYFVVDCDNYVAPCSLRQLVDLNLPIVAPLLRHVSPQNRYANFHGAVDANGYYAHVPEYDWLLDCRISGINRVPVVHCTYLVRQDVIPALTCDDASGRYEYVIFADSARKHGIDQYLDNREFYGCLTTEESVESLTAAERVMNPILDGTAPASDLMDHQYARYRAMADNVMRNASPFPVERFSGRGIVICGGGNYFVPAWICVNMIRHMGCNLPIELWYLGSVEINDAMAQLLRPLDVRCVDGKRVAEQYPVRMLNGWELKPFAIIHSSFEEVLYLDADNVPVADVTSFFDWPEYRLRGAVFWPDYRRLARDRTIWRICGVPYRDEPEFESGQILVNKRTCWRELQLTMHMNEHSDFYYQHVWGDKETFHMAWRKCRREYAMPSYPIETLACTMCQHGFRGDVIFQHRNLAKWTLDGNVTIQGFRHEESCLGFLRELKERWGGRFAPAEYTDPAERELYDRIVTQSYFRYQRVGYDERILRLAPHGVIDIGGAACEEEWMLQQIAGKIKLIILGKGRTTCYLELDERGVWRGRWENFEKMPILLTPTGAPLSPESRSSREEGACAGAL